MIQSGRILSDVIAGIPQLTYLVEKKALKKDISVAKDAAPMFTGKATEYYANKGINKLNKKI